jgi:hypothetical protein
MFYISPYITNTLFLATCILSGLQHWRLARPNPITNLQFGMIVFGMIMVLVVALYNALNPWLSLVFFLMATASLIYTIRQQRMLPPSKTFE